MLQPATRTQRWLLGLLLIWSLAIRLWYASEGLHSRRDHFYDERYNFDNVGSILKTGSFRPVSGWYPALAYLPQTALLAAVREMHERTGNETFAIYGEGGFTPLSYMLARSLNTLFGVLTILLVYLLGARILSPSVGLVAAFLMATIPQHIHHSAIFKPDVLLVLACLGATGLAVRSLATPGPANYAGTGAVVGLAMAAKLNGGLAAIPLITTTLLWLRSRPRVVFRLLLAGITAAAAFLLLNPYVGILLRFFRMNLRRYDVQATKVDGSHVGVVKSALTHLFRVDHFGPLLAGIAVTGILVWTWRVIRERDEHSRVLTVLLSFVFGYVLLTAAVTEFPRHSLFMPIFPVVCLATADLLLRPKRLPNGSLRTTLTVLVVLLLVWTFYRVNALTYRTLVPPTHQAAAFFLKSSVRRVDARLVCTNLDPPPEVRLGKRRAILRIEEDPAELPAGELDRCDGEIFSTDADASFLQRRRDRFDPASSILIEPKAFRLRGPELVAIRHPWRRAGEFVVALEPDEEGSTNLRGRMPLKKHSVVSLSVRLPSSVAEPTLLVGGVERPLVLMSGDRKTKRYLSRRFNLPAKSAVVLRVDRAETAPETICLAHRWRRPRIRVADR